MQDVEKHSPRFPRALLMLLYRVGQSDVGPTRGGTPGGRGADPETPAQVSQLSRRNRVREVCRGARGGGQVPAPGLPGARVGLDACSRSAGGPDPCSWSARGLGGPGSRYKTVATWPGGQDTGPVVSTVVWWRGPEDPRVSCRHGVFCTLSPSFHSRLFHPPCGDVRGPMTTATS